MASYRPTRRDLLKHAGVAGAAATTTGITLASMPNVVRAQDNTVKFYVRGDQAIFDVFGQLKEAFKEVEPDLEIEIEEAPGDDWHDKFLLKQASGDVPDCLFECDCTITSSVRAGALEPLDDFISGDERFATENYLDIAWNASVYEGTTYGLPYDGGSLVFFYNKALFEEAGVEPLDPETPMSWDQMIEIGKQLTKDRGGKRADEDDFDSGRILQYGLAPNTSIPWTWIWGNGGEVLTADGQVVLAEPAAIEGMQFMADLMNVHHISPNPQSGDTTTISFQTGNVAMEYNGVWNMVRYRELDFDWDVAPFPTGKTQVSTGWYSPLSITSGAKNKEGAWKWISFCCSEPGQRIVAELGQAVPPVRSLAESDVFLNPEVPPEHKQVFLDQLDPSILRTVGDTYGTYFGGYRKEWGQVFTPLFEEVLRGDRTAEEVAGEMQEKLQNLLDTGKVTGADTSEIACTTCGG
jgi:multiple sugar transport system substrate-binding protein